MESGHGKGPCDRVERGQLKKSAETWVKKEKVIYGAKNFYDWVKGHGGLIKTLYVTEGEVSLGDQWIKKSCVYQGHKCYPLIEIV